MVILLNQVLACPAAQAVDLHWVLRAASRLGPGQGDHRLIEDFFRSVGSRCLRPWMTQRRRPRRPGWCLLQCTAQLGHAQSTPGQPVFKVNATKVESDSKLTNLEAV